MMPEMDSETREKLDEMLDYLKQRYRTMIIGHTPGNAWFMRIDNWHDLTERIGYGYGSTLDEAVETCYKELKARGS